MYSIDTSGLMDGWSRFMPPDIVPGFWENMDNLIKKNDLIATEEVFHEIGKKDDELLEWAEKNKRMFVLIDDEIQEMVTRILSTHKKLIDTRNNRSGADPFVIAMAKLKKCKVISGETATNSVKRPNIPDVCKHYGIECITIYDLCREQGWKFS